MPASFRLFRRRVSAVLMVCSVLGFTACSALDVNDPTVIQDKDLDNATGAEYLWNVARWRFANAASRSAGLGGTLADEFFEDVDPSGTESYLYLDRRQSVEWEARAVFGSADREWQQLRADAAVALPRVRAFAPDPARGVRVGELFALRGFATLRLAEDICPGFPLREIDALSPVFGPPLTTDEAFTHAITEFDSALVYAVDSARVLNLARMGKARALLGLGRFSDAAAVASLIPGDYTASAVPTLEGDGSVNEVAARGIADREGGNGLDFLSAADPRVTVYPTFMVQFGDTTQWKYYTTKYPTRLSPIIVGDAIEARLIEAEAALNAHDASWLTILNDLRRTKIAPALVDLEDPVTFDEQVDLLFRERAFWLFATGHRLGDMRRLISRYGRNAETVFPTGPYRTVGMYGTATSLPFYSDREHAYNPAVTGCTSR